MGRSLQDLIAIALPYMIIPLIPIVSASFVYDPTMRLLLYAVLPKNRKFCPWFWACFVGEIHFLVMFAAVATPAWQLQVMSFELINKNLQNIVSTGVNRYFISYSTGVRDKARRNT